MCKISSSIAIPQASGAHKSMPCSITSLILKCTGSKLSPLRVYTSGLDFQKHTSRNGNAIFSRFKMIRTNLPNNINGSMAVLPGNMAPKAKIDEPIKHRLENKNTPNRFPSLSIRKPAKMTTTALLKKFYSRVSKKCLSHLK